MEKYCLNSNITELNTEKEYKKKLSSYVKNGTLDLLEYSYLLDFYSIGGSIVNSLWFQNLINKQNDKTIVKMIDNIFQHLFVTCKSKKILIDSNELFKDFVEIKKDTIVFTNDQIDAINQIINFLINFEFKTMGLYGFAGTGKTTIIVEMITYLLTKKLINSVVFTAPTNKAVNVIKSKFKSHLPEIFQAYYVDYPIDKLNFDDMIDKLYDIKVKIDFITIHKLMKFEIDYDADGELFFVRGNGDSLFREYELIIIDECSMIPLKLVESIFNEINMKTTESGNNFQKIPKVIFSGDPAQLPPVNEKNSILFLNNVQKMENQMSLENYVKIITDWKSGPIDCSIFSKKYDLLVNNIVNMSTITLKQVMRCRRDAVINICSQIRLWTINEIDHPNLKPYIDLPGINIFQYCGGSKIKTKWFQICLDLHQKHLNCNIILTWTNKQTDEYNQAIRSMLFQNKKINRFEIGDILMLSDFYNISSEDDLNVKDMKFHTSEQIKVVGIEIVTKIVPGFDTQIKNVITNNKKHFDNKYKNLIENLNTSTNRTYQCWKILAHKAIIENKDESQVTEKIYTFYVIHEDSEKIWNSEKDFISTNIKQFGKSLIAKYKENIKTIENHIIKPLWKKYHKNFIEPFANINYGYAITCHKAQGSNFYNVFVDAHDIVKNENESETKRCLYTAITRTSNELYLLI